jgi:hypothetical protein
MSSPTRNISFRTTDEIRPEILAEEFRCWLCICANVFYEGHSVTRSEKLQCNAAIQISSTPELFAGICGYWHHYMIPSTEIHEMDALPLH